MSEMDSIKEIHLRQDSFEQRLFRLEEMYKELKEQNNKILDVLTPISETYQTTTQVGKWVTGLMVFVSILLGVILSLKSLLKK